ncbi:MAG TPA: hypothetical protein VD769_02645 [Gaiellaceae bacterium]|nr:hypothetical protein [Gaiellaceae bacterium]
MKTITLLAALVAALALSACGGDDDSAAGDDTSSAGTSAPVGPGISIEEALETESAEPLLVSGNLLVVNGEPRLCSALAESFPPQCGGASLLITGLDLTGIDGLIVEGDVMWTDRPIKLAGVVTDGRLVTGDDAR